MSKIYVFKLASGHYKVGRTDKDPYERLDKAFSAGSVLVRSFDVDYFRSLKIEKIIHAQLAFFQDSKTDGKEIFDSSSINVINELFDYWQEPDNQKTVCSKDEVGIIEQAKAIPENQLKPPIPLTPELAKLLDQWHFHKTLKAKHEKLAEIAEQKLLLSIADSWGIAGELEWKPAEKETIDQKLLKKKYPEVAAECARKTKYRIIRALRGHEKLDNDI